jgi:hypothetical protein
MRGVLAGAASDRGVQNGSPESSRWLKCSQVVLAIVSISWCWTNMSRSGGVRGAHGPGRESALSRTCPVSMVTKGCASSGGTRLRRNAGHRRVFVG